MRFGLIFVVCLALVGQLFGMNSHQKWLDSKTELYSFTKLVKKSKGKTSVIWLLFDPKCKKLEIGKYEPKNGKLSWRVLKVNQKLHDKLSKNFEESGYKKLEIKKYNQDYLESFGRKLLFDIAFSMGEGGSVEFLKTVNNFLPESIDRIMPVLRGMVVPKKTIKLITTNYNLSTMSAYGAVTWIWYDPACVKTVLKEYIVNGYMFVFIRCCEQKYFRLRKNYAGRGFAEEDKGRVSAPSILCNIVKRDIMKKVGRSDLDCKSVAFSNLVKFVNQVRHIAKK
jgi:hypothetical protein